MELWIRSQDKKKLHKINKLELDNDETGIFDLEDYVLLGKYKTKERALEVLDEIQNYIIELDKAIIYSQTSIEDYSNVYEMPSE